MCERYQPLQPVLHLPALTGAAASNLGQCGAALVADHPRLPHRNRHPRTEIRTASTARPDLSPDVAAAQRDLIGDRIQSSSRSEEIDGIGCSQDMGTGVVRQPDPTIAEPATPPLRVRRNPDCRSRSRLALVRILLRRLRARAFASIPLALAGSCIADRQAPAPDRHIPEMSGQL